MDWPQGTTGRGDAAVQHLRTCLEQQPAGDTTEQVEDIFGALHEVWELAERDPRGVPILPLHLVPTGDPGWRERAPGRDVAIENR